MKEKPDKRKTNKTKAQIKERKLFSNLNMEWGRLSYEQKIEWHKLAKEDSVKHSGSGKKIKDGQQLFLSYNGFLQEIGEPINREAPILISPKDLLYIDLEIINNGSKSEIILHFEPAIDKGTKILLYSTEGLNIGKPKIDKRYFRKIDVLDSNFQSGSSIMAQYLRVFKKMPEKGKAVGIKLLPVSKTCGKIGITYEIPYPVK